MHIQTNLPKKYIEKFNMLKGDKNICQFARELIIKGIEENGKPQNQDRPSNREPTENHENAGTVKNPTTNGELED
jgi:hypothetical protein